MDKKSVEGQPAVRLCNYTDVYYRDTIEPGQEFMEATATHEQVESFRLNAGDVIITKDSETPEDIGVPAFVADGAPNLVCGYHLALIRPRPGRVDPRFLYWSMCSRAVRAQLTIAATGVTRFGLRSYAVNDARITLPTLYEQRRIADFLDDIRREAHAVLHRLGRLNSLIRERLSALREQLLAKSAPRARLKWYTRSIAQGESPQAEDRRAGSEEWGVLKLSAVHNGSFRPHEHKALPVTAEQAGLLPEEGDLLVTRANTPDLVGDCCVVEKAEKRLLLPDLIYRIRVDSAHLLPRYVMHFLLSPTGRSRLEAAARGTSQSMVKLRGTDILNVELPFPSIAEQAEIVGRLDAKQEATAAIGAKVTNLEQRVRERVDALTTAAVTGQLDPTSYRASAVVR